MEVIDRIIVSLVYFNAHVRDTLEYTLPRDSYDVKAYEQRKRVLTNELKVESPLKVFLSKQGENGEKTVKQIEEFCEDFYSDSSTIIRNAADGIRVDHAQNLKVLESTIKLHENINSIVRLHANYAAQHGIKNEVVDNLVVQDERFYRAVALLSLSREMFNQFQEYNKVRREANGERTPQSNFIENDLRTLNNLFFIVKNNATCKDAIYTGACDDLQFAIEMMNGRRDLPTGKNFGDVFNDASRAIADFVRDSEGKWREFYTPAINELVADSKAQQEAQANKTQQSTTEETK